MARHRLSSGAAEPLRKPPPGVVSGITVTRVAWGPVGLAPPSASRAARRYSRVPAAIRARAGVREPAVPGTVPESRTASIAWASRTRCARSAAMAPPGAARRLIPGGRRRVPADPGYADGVTLAPDAPPPSPATPFGAALVRRREALGYASQSELARRSRKLALLLRGHGLTAISQQTISRLEDDRDGTQFRRARPDTLTTLAYLLRWSAADFGAAVGIRPEPVPLLDVGAAQHQAEGRWFRQAREARGWSVEDTLRHLGKLVHATLDTDELEELELGLFPVAALPEPVRGGLWSLLGWRPDGEAPPPDAADAPGPVARPVWPLAALRPGAAAGALRTAWVGAGDLGAATVLVQAEDSAVAGVHPGDALFVEPGVDGLEVGRVYVVEAGGPPVVRRARHDATGALWFTADDGWGTAPLPASAVTVLGRVRLVQPAPRAL